MMVDRLCAPLHPDRKNAVGTSYLFPLSCYTWSMTDSEIQYQALLMEDLKNRKEAYTVLFNALGPEHYSTLEAEYRYAIALSHDGKEDESFSHMESAWMGLSKNLELSYYGHILYDLTFDYAAALYAKGEGEKAIKPITHILSASPSDDCDEDIIIELNYLLADCLEQAGKLEEAKLTLKLTYDLLLRMQDPGDYQVLTALSCYASFLNMHDETKKALKLLNDHRKLCEQWDDLLSVLIVTIFRAYIAKGTPTQAREISRAKKLLTECSDNDSDFPVENFMDALDRIKNGDFTDMKDILLSDN